VADSHEIDFRSPVGANFRHVLVCDKQTHAMREKFQAKIGGETATSGSANLQESSRSVFRWR